MFICSTKLQRRYFIKKILINALKGTNEWFVLSFVFGLFTIPIGILIHRETLIDLIIFHSMDELILKIIAVIGVWFFIFVLEVGWQAIKETS